MIPFDTYETSTKFQWVSKVVSLTGEHYLVLSPLMRLEQYVLRRFGIIKESVALSPSGRDTLLIPTLNTSQL